jgi:hypothetical protein
MEMKCVVRFVFGIISLNMCLGAVSGAASVQPTAQEQHIPLEEFRAKALHNFETYLGHLNTTLHKWKESNGSKGHLYLQQVGLIDFV